MKIWKYILSAAALLSLGACNHDGDEMTIPTRDLDIANHSAVVVNDLTAEEEFTLTWTAAHFGIDTEVEYSVSATTENGVTVTLGTTTDLYYTTTNGELIEAVGAVFGGDYYVDFTVTAITDSAEVTCSDNLTVKFTYDKKVNMLILGAYQGWDATKPASRLVQGEDGLLRGFVNILSDTDNEVKFAVQLGDNNVGASFGVINGLLSSTADAANIALSKGLHYLQVDINTMTLVNIPLTKVALIGEAVGGWDKDYAEFAFNAETNVWTATVENVVKEKEYKIRFNDMWDVVDAAGNGYNISLGGENNNLAMGGGNLKASFDGKVTFTLNLFDAPYTLAEEGPAPTLLYIIGAYQGWNHSNPHSTLVGEKGVLTGFLNVPNADSKEFKLCSQLNWDGPNYGQQDGTISTDGGAGNLTLEPGLWYIVFDYYANTLTTTAITKVGLIGNGEVFGNWGSDVEMAYDATAQTWSVTVENVPADNEYKVRFNGGWDINLGGSATNLTPGGDNLKTVKSGTVTYVLDIFAHPYTIVEK